MAFAWSNTNARNYYFKIIELSNNQRVTEYDFWSKSSLYDKTTSANLLILGKSDAELKKANVMLGRYRISAKIAILTDEIPMAEAESMFFHL